MTERSTKEWGDADKHALWHPFTPVDAWCDDRHDPLVIDRGDGAFLWDTEGNRYLDANSSIWTNIHGHNHPVINAAIRKQLEVLAHASFLGTTNKPAIELAEKLVGLFPDDTLSRVFYSDDGSTAIECAVKMSIQFWQLSGSPERCEVVTFDGAYHGDTLGASSMGGIATFHDRFAKFGYPVRRVTEIAELELIAAENVAAVCLEPLIQGAAGMRFWPEGMLRELRAWCDRTGVLLIFDEVMTGFGRTGKVFACEHEEVVPDFIALAKGLTGGYLPLGATLTTDRVFDAFRGDGDRTFYYGHSYCGNPLGCASALASLELFGPERTLSRLVPKIDRLAEGLRALEAESPHVVHARNRGFIGAFDLVDGRGKPFPRHQRVGADFCQQLRGHGILTRPVNDTIVLMLPLCTPMEALDELFGGLLATLGSFSP
ncbi:MAG: adenosylmethionine--8-amino-7-oxononanoate transaminase [Verrucomicrobiota bacterium]